MLPQISCYRRFIFRLPPLDKQRNTGRPLGCVPALPGVMCGNCDSDLLALPALHCVRCLGLQGLRHAGRLVGADINARLADKAYDTDAIRSDRKKRSQKAFDLTEIKPHRYNPLPQTPFSSAQLHRTRDRIPQDWPRCRCPVKPTRRQLPRNTYRALAETRSAKASRAPVMGNGIAPLTVHFLIRG